MHTTARVIATLLIFGIPFISLLWLSGIRSGPIEESIDLNAPEPSQEEFDNPE